MSERNVWGFWDCTYCGNKHIRGDNDDCPNCGHRRDANVKFYVDTNNLVEVSEEQKSDKANWICAYCGNQNAADLQECSSCSAPRAEAKGDYFSINNAEEEEPEPSPPPPKQGKPLHENADTGQEFGFNLNSRSRIALSKIVKVVIPILACAVFIFGMVMFFKWFNTPIEKQITIDNVQWTRSINIEELRTYNESGWSLPSNARLSYTREEIRSYDHVIDHYETRTRRVSSQSIVGYTERVVGYDDLGNGQFRERKERVPEYTTIYDTETYQEPVYRDEPVYDTKYYYEIDRWKKSRSVDTSGYDKNPYWGEVILRYKERQSTKRESYYISGQVDGKTQRYQLNLPDWQKYNVGDTLKLTVKRGNNEVISIDSLAAYSTSMTKE